MNRKSPAGLTAQIKEKLIQQSLERRLRRRERDGSAPASIPRVGRGQCRNSGGVLSVRRHPGYQQLRIIADSAAQLGIDSPYFKQHDGIAGARTRIGGREYLNFSSYNYLGLSGHPEIAAAAKSAIDRYGTSVSASRAVSGERPLHRELEAAIADAYGTQNAVVFVSGHATNVTSIGYLFGPRDLVLHDELIHNSTLQGIALSGARRLPFAHNDWEALDALLTQQRHQFERVLIVIEGIYSMDGDFPELPRFIEIKRRHKAFLMIDEAHSFGVMGATGLGIREHFGLQGGDVDIWMGTLSKALAGCGGYIAGETALVEHLKFLAPGFLYSVGMAPPVAAASLAALECLRREPQRAAQAARARRAVPRACARIGHRYGHQRGPRGHPRHRRQLVRAARVSAALFERGINVQPILYPGCARETRPPALLHVLRAQRSGYPGGGGGACI